MDSNYCTSTNYYLQRQLNLHYFLTSLNCLINDGMVNPSLVDKVFFLYKIETNFGSHIKIEKWTMSIFMDENSTTRLMFSHPHRLKL